MPLIYPKFIPHWFIYCHVFLLKYCTLYVCFLVPVSNELPGMTTTCDATEVNVTLDATELSDMDTSHLYVGIDPNNAVCQATQSGNIITLLFAPNQCNPDLVASGNS